MKEVVVIGGGPAGIFAALYAASNHVHVTLLEKNNEPLKKLLLTGSGKCNFWNQDQDLKHFHSESSFLAKIFNKENFDEVYKIILGMGIIPICKENYMYPYSMQSFTVKHAFLEEVRLKNIDFELNCEVLLVSKNDSDFEIMTNKGKYKADAVVLCSGSRAYPKTGSDGKGYELASNLGHSIVPVLPSLVGLEMSEIFLNDWAGVRSHVKVSLVENGHVIISDEGEIQLTRTGISGICVFHLSRQVARGLFKHQDEMVEINFLPFVSDVKTFLDEQNQIVKNRDIGTLLEAILNYKIVDVILKRCNIKRNSFYAFLSKEEKDKLIAMLSAFPCKIIGTKGFDSSQVCSGGVCLDEIDLSRMESKIVKGLFFAGEVLDIDGDCGGYNLETAFISGMIAGKGVLNYFIHSMKLVDFAFQKIVNQEKDIEVRLNDEKRKTIKVGDFIEFENITTHEKVLAQVVRLHPFDSFDQLFSSFDYKRLGINKEEDFTIMNQFYSLEEQKKYGALGIEIKLL